MDTFARALKAAAKMLEDKTMTDLVKKRYASFDSGLGAAIEADTSSLEALAQHAAAVEIVPTSGKQEMCEMLLNDYV